MNNADRRYSQLPAGQLQADEQLGFYLPDEAATVAFGGVFADACKADREQLLTVFLEGDLGAGKTTFARGLLNGLGHTGAVKSPTYTLVEPYLGLSPPVYHFDLYRLADPEELEFIGFRDYLQQNGLLLIEWPKKGQGYLPPVDVIVKVRVFKNQQTIGRKISMVALSQAGENILSQIAASS